MHNNYYFLRQLSRVLAARLAGTVISECFSQNKDELVVRFEKGSESFFLRAALMPDLSALSFPGNFQRARRNSVDIFPSACGARVAGVRQFENERSFAIGLEDGHALLFKMHGNRANVILVRDGQVEDLFRKNLVADAALDMATLDRDIDWSREAFDAHHHDLRALYFTFGKVVWQVLASQGFFEKSVEEKWKDIQSLKKQLEDPRYFLCGLGGKPVLSLLPAGEVLETYDEPIKACNEYWHFFTQRYVLTKERGQVLSALKTRLAAAEGYCTRSRERLASVAHDDRHREWADLIMANLHAIPPGAEQAEVSNFYRGGETETIKLKKDLSPQKNAELFYRKAKNRHLEVTRLEESIRQKQEEIAALRARMEEAEAAADLKSLRALRDAGPEKKDATPLPFHEFEFRGFRIWVGKNAQSNDTLTLRHSHKDDLWLHAKDVSGSHVLIKHQSGKNFPKDVIEYAASLAAYNSKRRNESLCPVAFTPKKFVRKRKGDPTGAVVVEREEVILVEPAGG